MKVDREVEMTDSGLRDTTLGPEGRAIPLPWNTLSILKVLPECLMLPFGNFS